MNLREKMCALQGEFIIGKTKRNEFGNFNYRNLEDMLAVLKPLLKKYGMFVTFTDRVTIVADRIYVISTVTAYDAEGETKDGEPACLSCEAYAREPLNKKGMDESQITGTATSYARKNALAALFAVDSGDRDPDEEDHSDKIGEPEKGTNGLTALKMLDDLDLARPGYSKKMCAAKGVNDTSELTIEYIEKAWNAIVKTKLEGKNGNV